MLLFCKFNVVSKVNFDNPSTLISEIALSDARIISILGNANSPSGNLFSLKKTRSSQLYLSSIL